MRSYTRPRVSAHFEEVHLSIDTQSKALRKSKLTMPPEFKNGTRQVIGLSLAYLAAVLAANCGAQNNKALTVEDNLSIRYFAEYTPISFSPDGRLLTYTVRSNQRNYLVEPGNYQRTGIEWYSIGADVHIVDSATKKSRNLTSNEGNNSFPSWSPDGNFLAFLSDRDGGGQAKLWVWDRRKDQIRKVSDTILRCEQIEWTPDDHQILVTALPINFSPAEYVRKTSPETEASDSTEDKTSDFSVTTFQSHPHSEGNLPKPVSSSDPWNLNRYLRDLVAIDLESGHTSRIVEGEKISRFSLSPDGTRVAYSTPTRFEHAGSQQILYDLLMVDMHGNRRDVLASDICLDYDGSGFSWSADSTRVSVMTGGPGAGSSKLYIVDVDRAVPRLLYDNAEVLPHYSSPLWDTEGNVFFISRGTLWRVSARSEKAFDLARIQGWDIREIIRQSPNLLWRDEDGRTAVVVAKDTGSKEEGIFSVDLSTGRTKELLKGMQCLACANEYLASGTSGIGPKVAFLREDSAHPSDLWALSPAQASPVD